MDMCIKYRSLQSISINLARVFICHKKCYELWCGYSLKISYDQNLESCMHLGGVSHGFLSSYREYSLMKGFPVLQLR